MWQSLIQKIQLGPNWYGLYITFGIFLSYILTKKRAKFSKQENINVDELYLYLIPFGIIGARIYHVLSWFSYYRLFPKEIFYIWQGGLGIYGGFLGGVLAILLISRRKKIPFLILADLVSPLILLAQAIGRIGNYFNQEAFGPPTDLPWKIYVPLEKRPVQFLEKSFFHPTFFYESILCLIAFIVLLRLEKKGKFQPGFTFGGYLISYGLIRFLTEFLRFDTWQIQGVKVAQVISILFISTGIFLIRNGVKDKKLVK